MFLLTAKSRHLIISSLYWFATAFYILHALLHSELYSFVDLSLLLTGLLMSAVVATRSVYNKYQNIFYDQTNKVQVINNTASHSLMNAMLCVPSDNTLNIASSSLYVAGDVIYLHKPTPSIILRLSGSLLLFHSAARAAHLLTQQRCKEKLNELIKPYGIEPSVYHLIDECQSVVTGLLYASSIYTEEEFYPLKVIGIACWLLAGIHETQHAYKQMVNGRQRNAYASLSLDLIRAMLINTTGTDALNEGRAPNTLRL